MCEHRLDVRLVVGPVGVVREVVRAVVLAEPEVVVAGDRDQFGVPGLELGVEFGECYVGATDLVGRADDEVDTRRPDLLREVGVPLVVVVPRERVGSLDSGREPPEVVGAVRAEITDVHGRPGGVLADPGQRLVDVVRAGGHERPLAVGRTHQRHAGESVGVRVRHHRRVRLAERRRGLLLGALRLQGVRVKKALARKHRLPRQREPVTVDESIVHTVYSTPASKKPPESGLRATAQLKHLGLHRGV